MAVPIHTEGYSWFQQKSETFAAQLSYTVPLTDKIYSKVWLKRTEIVVQSRLNLINSLSPKLREAGFFSEKGKYFFFEIDLFFFNVRLNRSLISD